MSRGRARRQPGHRPPAAGHRHVFLLEICAMAGGLGAIAHARIKECSVRSSGLPSLCWGWSRISPCPSFGRCWRRFPSACLAGGWRTAATGSDAGILSRSDSSIPTTVAARHPATSLLRCCLISLKKLFPWGIVPPKFSAIVCPMSASVSRTPRFTPAPPPGEYAKIGTYSRE